MEKNTGRFRIRTFVTLMLLLSGLGLPMTGIANHMCGFSGLTTARHAWMAAHNVLGLLFSIFVIWHVTFNYRAVWNHIKSAVGYQSIVGREILLAGALMALALVYVSHAFLVGE